MMAALFAKHTEPRLTPLQSSLLLLVTIEPGLVDLDVLLEKIRAEYWRDTTMAQVRDALQELRRRKLVDLIEK